MTTKITPKNNQNLFYQLYSTSQKVTQSGYVCNSATDESDTSFDISGSSGEITDSNGDTLASIDFSQIHADGITEYHTETKIIQPQSAFLLQGNVKGEAYAAQYFEFPEEVYCKQYYDAYTNIRLKINYEACDELRSASFDTYDVRTEAGSFVPMLQDLFDKNNVPVTVSIKYLDTCVCTKQENCAPKHDYLCFEGTTPGVSFYVFDVYATGITQEYVNKNGEWSDYTESPFVGANPDFDYCLNLIRTWKPRLIGETGYTDYTDVPCDIYKYFITFAPTASEDRQMFSRHVKVLQEYEKLFDETGRLINGKEKEFITLSNQYNDIYSYYFGHQYGILRKYNIHDIIKMLLQVSAYTAQANIHGPYKLQEEYCKRVLPVKYPNGALRGVVIIPDWPDTIDELDRTIKVAHVSDTISIEEEVELPKGLRVEGFVCNKCIPLYIKYPADVRINVIDEKEKEVYKESVCSALYPMRKITSNAAFEPFRDGIWTNSIDKIQSKTVWTSSPSYYQDSAFSNAQQVTSLFYEHEHTQHNTSDEYVDEYKVPAKYDFMERLPGYNPKTHQVEYGEHEVGLYGYMKFLGDNNLWINVGQGYMLVGGKDDYQSKEKNLQNPVLIYNPLNVPIRVKMMVFS